MLWPLLLIIAQEQQLNWCGCIHNCEVVIIVYIYYNAYMEGGL